MKKSYCVLAFSLLLAFSAWGADEQIETWAEIFYPPTAFPLIGSLASVVIAWLGKSPIKQS